MSLIVFLVEDSATIRESLIPTLLELVDAEVVDFSEGEDEARQWLNTHSHWKLAVVDLFLKQGNGLGVLQTLKQREPHQLVAVLTNYPTAEMRQRCMALGANRVFDKSTELDEFFAYCTEITPH